MKYLLVPFVIAVAALFNVAASADTSEVMFSADAVVRVPNGHYDAKLYYLYNRTRKYLLLEYSTPIKMTDLIDYTDGTRFKVCTKCESGYHTQPAPVLYSQKTDNKTSEVENGCTKYIPADTSGVTALWYKADGTVCKAELPDGRTLVLSNIDKTFKDRTKFNLVGKKCPAPVCKRVMDIVFVVDNSGSVGEWNWLNPIKKFLNQLVQAFDIGQDATQVGLLTYAYASRTVFKLSPNKDYIIKTINGAKYSYGGTCTGCGIHTGLDFLKDPATHRKELDPEKILMVITDGENWDKQQSGVPCANYAPVCTKNGTTCTKKICPTGYQEFETKICEQYADDTTKCKRRMCKTCRNNKWGANCVTEECIKWDNNKCAVRDTSYCERAFHDCSVKNGAIVQNKAIPCVCSKYKCIEKLCTKYNCSEYSCDDCTAYGDCVEYEKKCVKYAKIKNCSVKETCTEYECIAGDVKCTKTHNSKQGMLMGAIIRSRTQWVLYPATTRLPIVISIGVGRAFENELMATASTLQGKTLMYLVSDFQALLTLLNDLVDETCIKQADNLEFCNDDCKAFCGCEGKCYCPTCDKSTGYCYSIGCTTDNKTSAGCVAKHNTCPNNNKCINLKPNNNTAGCCVQSSVDCRRFGNRCFNAKCGSNSGCYSEPIEPVPENSCFVGDKCYNQSGWTYKSACPFIDKCTNNVCRNESATTFSCTAEPKCNSHDKCITDTCDKNTGKCGQIHKVCNSTNGCVIPYCYDGDCYERVNDTLKSECNKLTDAKSCKRGYCDAASGTCKTHDYSKEPSCNACANFNVRCEDNDTACSTFSCDVRENNEPYCKETKTCTPPENPCMINTCNETTGECTLEDVECDPIPCGINQCVPDSTKPEGYECRFESFCEEDNPCYVHTCDATTNECVKTTTCPPKPCHLFDKCYITDDNKADCRYIPKTCTARSECEVAYCDDNTSECVYEDITATKCPRLPCMISGCDPLTGCYYTPVNCDDDNNCTIDECVSLDEYSLSESGSGLPAEYADSDEFEDEFHAESKSNLAYVCAHRPKCTTPNFCERATCSLGSGYCTTSLYFCEDMNQSAVDECHAYECDEETRSCKIVLLPAAFLDVCGSCVKEYGKDPNANSTSLKDRCIAGMSMPNFTAAISGAAIALIVIVAIIVAAILSVSAVIGTKELIKRAKKTADVGTNSNPLYEEKDNEGLNPTFMEAP